MSMTTFFRNLAFRKVPYWGHYYVWTGRVDADFIDNEGKCRYCGDVRWFSNLLGFDRASKVQCPARPRRTPLNFLRRWLSGQTLSDVEDILKQES